MCLNKLDNIIVAAISDMHGIFPKIREEFDLLLLAGDNVDLDHQSNSNKTFLWYTCEFCDWINLLPFKDDNSKVVVIAGNHEVGLERMSKTKQVEMWNIIQEKTNNRVIYLFNEAYTFSKNDKSINVFGTPYCRIFGYWAYMRPKEKLIEKYSKIPENCDILLSHDAPYGTSDLCYGWRFWGKELEHIGNEALRDAILEKQPKYCIHGHLHSANHECELLGSTKVYCVSLVDEDYVPTYNCLYLEF